MLFIKVKPMPAGSLDLAEAEYLKNIDFGNEVRYGRGETIVDGFDVALTGTGGGRVPAPGGSSMRTEAEILDPILKYAADRYQDFTVSLR
jgi:hypothetical protein